MSNGSVWNPENIKDVAESVGISSLSSDVVDHLTRDVEFRIAQVLEEALKFMRHAKRTTLFTADVSQALRVLDVEPLYGYESTRPLRFGEASLGPGQPLFYLEDEEVDFEKLINAPLPKVPREICFTAHWLAVEGVQPTIPQNPAPSDLAPSAVGRPNTDLNLLPRGPSANPHLAATAGADNITVKPLVKHILSKELQLYFEHVSGALLDEANDSYRLAALTSLRSDPGLHQLVPYFVHFAAEKVTHNLKNLFVLTQTMQLVAALLENPHLYIAPYVASLVPPVLTCLIGKRLGPSVLPPPPETLNGTVHTPAELPPHYRLRDLAASVLHSLTRKKYADSTPTLKPRLARTLLKHLLSHAPQPLGTYYGALLGLRDVAGAEGVRALVLPNLGPLDEVLREVLVVEGVEVVRRREVEAVVDAVVGGLQVLVQESAGFVGSGGEVTEEEKGRVVEKVGEVVAERVLGMGNRRMVDVILAQDGLV